jgi:hypothetical protein
MFSLKRLVNRYGNVALFMQSGTQFYDERPAAVVCKYKTALQEVEEKAERERERGGDRT